VKAGRAIRYTCGTNNSKCSINPRRNSSYGPRRVSKSESAHRLTDKFHLHEKSISVLGKGISMLDQFMDSWRCHHERSQTDA
jgi:hypothetical protein